MCDQLDVFLQQETRGFVDKLFNTLETKSYLQSNPEPPSAKTESTNEQGTSVGQVTNGQNIVIPPTTVPVPAPVLAPSSTTTTTIDSRTKKSDRTKRRSWSPRSRSRSRSRDRDRDRTRRSRSRDRSTRDRGGRSTWDDRRNRRSPVNRRSDRRRSRSPLPPRRSSRSPRGARRQRSPVPPPAIVLDNVVAPPAAVRSRPIRSCCQFRPWQQLQPFRALS